MDAQVPLATTPNAFGAAGNYRNFSQREINRIVACATGGAKPCTATDGHRSLITTASPCPPDIGVVVPNPVAVNPCPYTFPLTELLDTDPTYCLFVPRTISPFPPTSCARRAINAITAPRRLRTGAVSAFRYLLVKKLSTRLTNRSDMSSARNCSITRSRRILRRRRRPVSCPPILAGCFS